MVPLMLETVILLLHPISIKISIQENKWFLYFYALNLLKIYFYSRFFINISRYNNLMVYDICFKHCTQTTIHFLVKCIMKTNGFIIIVYSLLHVIFVNSYLILIFSVFTDKSVPEELGYYYSDYYNCFFHIITSMTTVGYGEVHIKSQEQRLVTIASVFLGQFLISIMILWAMSSTNFTTFEERAFVLLKRMLLSDQQKSFAQKIILYNYRKYKLEKLLIVEYRKRVGLNTLFLKKRSESIKIIDFKESNKDIMSHRDEEKPEAYLLVLEENFNLNDHEINHFFNNPKVNQIKQKIQSLSENLSKIGHMLFQDACIISDNLYFELKSEISYQIDQTKIAIENLQGYKEKLERKLVLQKRHIKSLETFSRNITKVLKPVVCVNLFSNNTPADTVFAYLNKRRGKEEDFNFNRKDPREMDKENANSAENFQTHKLLGLDFQNKSPFSSKAMRLLTKIKSKSQISDNYIIKYSRQHYNPI